MKVVVEVYGALREKLGWSKKTIEIPSSHAMLGQVLEKLGIAEIVLEDNKIREGFIVLVNGIHAQFTGQGETPIKDGDIISIFPPGGGG